MLVPSKTSLSGGLQSDLYHPVTIDSVIGASALVRAKADFTLPSGSANAFVEDLRMQGGFGNIDGRGNSLDNTIEGNSGKNTLRGNGGDDRILAGEGNDALYGGQGEDRMEGESGNDNIRMGSGDVAFGGPGKDDFIFSGASLGMAGSDGPVIRDFDGVTANDANGEDKIVYATGLEVGSFSYIDGATFSGGGNSEARFGGARQIQVDQDGDGLADQAFLVDGVTAANRLTSSDFMWL